MILEREANMAGEGQARKLRTKRRVFAILLLGILLVCAGCSGGEEDAAGSQEDTAAQEDAGSQEDTAAQEDAAGQADDAAQETSQSEQDDAESSEEAQGSQSSGETAISVPENASAVQRGMAYLEAGDLTSAQACFEEAITEEKDMRDAYRGIGIVKMSQEDYEGAIENFDLALANSGMEADSLAYDISYYKAAAYVKLGELNAALEVYNHLVAYKPTADTYMGRGAVYARMGNLEMARADFDHVLDGESNNYDRYVEIFQLLEDAGQTEAGQEYLRRALEIQKDKDADNLERGKIYYYLQEYDNAKTELERADDSDAQVLLYKGLVYDALGDFSYAKTMYEGYLEQENSDGSIYNLIASSEMSSGNYEEALSTIQRGLEYASDSRQELYRNEIIAYEYLGDFETAKTKMEAYLEMYPQDEEAAREYVFLKTRS